MLRKPPGQEENRRPTSFPAVAASEVVSVHHRRMEPVSPAPGALSELLEQAAKLPAAALVLVLRPLPMPELARPSCVQKAFLVAWRSLQELCPGRRYAPPSDENFCVPLQTPGAGGLLGRRGCYPLHGGCRRGRARCTVG